MSEIALRYLGGAWIHGVPARDLTAGEAALHGELIRDQEAATGMRMYEPVAPAPASAARGKREQQPAEEMTNG
jgi:hypothetical protein